MYLYNKKIKINKKSNIYSCLKKIYGFNYLHNIYLIKYFGLNVYKSKNLILLCNKFNLILREIIDNRNDLDILIKKKNKINLKKKIENFPLIRYKFSKGYPIRGQKTRTNARTSRRLNKFF